MINRQNWRTKIKCLIPVKRFWTHDNNHTLIRFCVCTCMSTWERGCDLNSYADSPSILYSFSWRTWICKKKQILKRIRSTCKQMHILFHKIAFRSHMLNSDVFESVRELNFKQFDQSISSHTVQICTDLLWTYWILYVIHDFGFHWPLANSQFLSRY